MPTLHLQVCAGFANRVRALISGVCAAELLKLSLVIHWFPKSPECACRFSTVLDPESLPKAVKVVPEDLYQAREVLSQDDWKELMQTWDGTSDLHIKSYGIFFSTSTWNTHLQALRPSPFVKEMLQRRCGSVDWTTAVGVHIRRTDNWKSIEGSPTESFLQAMRSRPETIFVVATDDKELRETLLQEFGTRCIFPATTLSRRTEEGMISGVADFFALSKCSRIWGSYASSFSEIAARYGSTELKILTHGGEDGTEK